MCSIDRDGTTYDDYRDSKLFKVNFTFLMKCGTIEFWQYSGTTDIIEINM